MRLTDASTDSSSYRSKKGRSARFLSGKPDSKPHKVKRQLRHVVISDDDDDEDGDDDDSEASTKIFTSTKSLGGSPARQDHGAASTACTLMATPERTTTSASAITANSSESSNLPANSLSASDSTPSSQRRSRRWTQCFRVDMCGAWNRVPIHTSEFCLVYSNSLARLVDDTIIVPRLKIDCQYTHSTHIPTITYTLAWALQLV